ncbi:hypothetical protein [Brevibacillus laterosporus]|uniref:hypothetical protein n=1 Tax=Brevibacillus laterosporus TaxID=1465 RepID=UPI003D1D33CD
MNVTGSLVEGDTTIVSSGLIEMFVVCFTLIEPGAPLLLYFTYLTGFLDEAFVCKLITLLRILVRVNDSSKDNSVLINAGVSLCPPVVVSKGAENLIESPEIVVTTTFSPGFKRIPPA